MSIELLRYLYSFQDHNFKFQPNFLLCTVFLVYLQVTQSEVSEPSTDSQRSHASLPPEPVNRSVQHLRGFRLTPGISPAIEFIEFTSFIYVSLRLRVQDAVPTQPCVGKLEISLVLLNFLHCNFR